MKVLRPPSGSDTVAAFESEVAKLRVILAAGRSTVFLRLFDYLVERSNDERAPKEVEIALAVFGNEGPPDLGADSGVRVYVHRLRRRLDDHYLGKAGPRLEIPKGEYRIVVTMQSGGRGGETPWSWLRGVNWSGAAGRWLVLAPVVLLCGLAVWLLWPSERIEPRVRDFRASAYWRPIYHNQRALIVVGDAFLVAETEDQKDIRRMILEPDIRSREDLGKFFATHPEAFYRLYDLDLHFAPIGSAVASWQVQNAIANLRLRSSDQPRLITSSMLKTEELETDDIVYVGRISSLGLLAAPLFQASAFRPGRHYNELVDLPSGRRFAADLNPGKSGNPRTDYGYLASLPVPSGKRMLVVAGIGDMAVQSMAALVSDPAQLRSLEPKFGSGGAFEALFEVRTIDDLALDRRPVIIRRLR